MPGSISERVAADVENMEHQVWRALKEAGDQALPFLSEDLVMVLFDGTVLDAKKNPKPKDYLKSDTFIPWLTYEMGEIHVVEIDMMAATIIYSAQASRAENGQRVTYSLKVSSTWRQRANAKWYMCVHHQTSI